MPKSILVVNGPNLDLLGTREPERYGTVTLESIERALSSQAAGRGATVNFFQSNAEADLVTRIHRAGAERCDFILINPAAFTHTSIAVRDALSAVKIPFIEIHLSNIYAREPFRKQSYFSDLAVGVVSGLGAQGYELALTYILESLSSP
jgi:3-dehydroquinate dehydratase II